MLLQVPLPRDLTYSSKDSAALQAGLDSLGAVELRTAIGSAFGLELSSTFVFDYPTQAAMTAYILQAIALRDVHPSQAAVSMPPHKCLSCESSPPHLVCGKQARGKGPRAASSGGVCQVVGLSSRFPSAIKHSEAAQSALPGASLFWQNQVLGRDLAEIVPYHRWDVDAAYAPNGGLGKAYELPAKSFLLLHAPGTFTCCK